MLKMKRIKTIQIVTEVNENLLANVVIADSYFKRLKGLMWKKNLNKDEGLLIKPCNSIHTFFMKINLDVIFIDKNNTIIEIYKNMLPWRISKIHKNSIFCIEGNAGSFENLKKGEKIKIKEKA
ncbi:MAG: DUF192 domain-containing protein [Firmicutes bacterium]|nr:DUF192 domain-containing protein [Bacillota bacterium]